MKSTFFGKVLLVLAAGLFERTRALDLLPECVPATTCHPTQCVFAGEENISEDDDTAVSCTAACLPWTLDCGGQCRFEKDRCKAFTADGAEIFPVSRPRKRRMLERLECRDSACQSCQVVDIVQEGMEDIAVHGGTATIGRYFCDSYNNRALFVESQNISHRFFIRFGQCLIDFGHRPPVQTYTLWRGCGETFPIGNALKCSDSACNFLAAEAQQYKSMWTERINIGLMVVIEVLLIALSALCYCGFRIKRQSRHPSKA